MKYLYHKHPDSETKGISQKGVKRWQETEDGADHLETVSSGTDQSSQHSNAGGGRAQKDLSLAEEPVADNSSRGERASSLQGVTSGTLLIL